MEGSKIEWCDHTFNPWVGCTKVSPGCAHCYAEAMNKRFKGGNWGPGAPRRRTSEANWRKPVQWNKTAEKQQQLPIPENGGRFRRPRVFCASMADWLDEEVPIDWLADLLALIRKTPHLDWLLLTKRPEKWDDRIGEVLCGLTGDAYDWLWDWIAAEPPHNVWIGTTVEDQARADERIPELLKIPAPVRFLSCEPLLGPLDLYENQDGFYGSIPDGIHWVICGGESGPGCRPMEKAWAASLRLDCRGAAVPFFMKQLGGHPDKRHAWEDLPLSLQVRQFP